MVIRVIPRMPPQHLDVLLDSHRWLLFPGMVGRKFQEQKIGFSETIAECIHSFPLLVACTTSTYQMPRLLHLQCSWKPTKSMATPPSCLTCCFFHKVWACAETAAGIAVAIDGATAILLELDHLVHCYGIAQPWSQRCNPEQFRR